MFKYILKILIKFNSIISLVSFFFLFLCILDGNFAYANNGDDFPLPDGNDIPKEVILCWVLVILMMWLIPRHNEFERLTRSLEAVLNENGEQPLVKYKLSNPPTDIELDDVFNKFVNQCIENNFHSQIFILLDFIMAQIIICVKLILYFYPNFKNYINGFNVEDIFYNILSIAQPIYLLYYSTIL